MNCEQCRASMLAYVGQEPDATEAVAFWSHLEMCETCGTIFEEEKSLTSLLRSAGPLYPVPPHLRQKIQMLIQEAAAPSFQVSGRLPRNSSKV